MRLRRVWSDGGRAEPDRRQATHGGALLKTRLAVGQVYGKVLICLSN